MTNKIKIWTAVGVMLLSSCSLYQKYEANPTVPTDIMGNVAQPDDTLSLGAIEWRQLFTDPLLQELIEKALQNNTDVRQAKLTVEQAQNDLKSAQLGWFPIISFEPSGSLTRFNSATTRSYIIPLTATWQAGIFGQVTTKKRLAKAKRQQLDDYRQAVQTALAANIASTYYQLVMLDRQLQILQETQVVWEESLEAMRVLFEAGLYMSPAVYQMEASLASVKSGIVETQETIYTTEAALCLLLSEPPHSITRAQYGRFVMPEQLHVGLPIRLLSARPDVRQAERNMEIAFYERQQAKQAFYPDLTLSGTLGWSNGEGAVNPSQFLANAVASITQRIFSQGQLRAQYKNATIEQEKVRLQFVQTLLNAGNEVYQQLRICHKTEQKAAYLTSIINSLHEAYLGTSELMKNGTNTYVEVLKAQEDLLTAQITEVQNHFEGIQALINLYTALGGFQPMQE
ncbi:MAG: TolC family protein [Bacteroidaceae bacterium]|nr:TolC family protein [Bacteroidaceae bacterium]